MITNDKGRSVLLLAFLFSCAPLLPNRDQPVDYTGSGMKKVAAAGSSFQQGWGSMQASCDERPGMESSFAYDYWLDSV
jgi:hypothetical protein